MNIFESLNWDDVETGGNNLIPAGQYMVVIAEAKDSKSKTSESRYIKLSLVIGEGEEENKRLFTNVVYQGKDGNPNKVGLSQLKTIFKLWNNKENFKEPSELEGMKLRVSVKIVDDVQYGKKNEVSILAPRKSDLSDELSFSL